MNIGCIKKNAILNYFRKNIFSFAKILTFAINVHTTLPKIKMAS